MAKCQLAGLIFSQYLICQNKQQEVKAKTGSKYFTEVYKDIYFDCGFQMHGGQLLEYNVTEADNDGIGNFVNPSFNIMSMKLR